MVAASLASTSGCLKSLSNTRAATRSSLVASAAAMSAGTGASWSPKWSGMKKVEKPRSSALRARPAHASAEGAFETWMPKRKGRCAAMAGEASGGPRLYAPRHGRPRAHHRHREGDVQPRRPRTAAARHGRGHAPRRVADLEVLL